MNVMEFGGGKLGAVNGMTKSGQLEIVSMQSEEIWTGVTYSLSSTMIMEVNILFYFFLFYIFFCY
jgi:non-lysosomal glucosylceramidase